MSCGNLTLQDPIGRSWILTAGDDGVLVTTLVSTTISNFVAPILKSPSFFWQLSVGLDGAVIATPTLTASTSTAFTLTSLGLRIFSLSIGDDGVLLTTSQAGRAPISVPYPIDVSMSVWPPLGLTSSISGATPLTVSADFSIWSCTLNQFINEDTTNIIVVLDE